MTVEVRLFATLTQFLPPDSKGGTAFVDVPDTATIGELIGRLGIPSDLDCVLLLNGANAEAHTRLREGNVIDIFPPLAGGGQ